MNALVLIKFDESRHTYLFEAPVYSLKVEDYCICDTCWGKKRGKVVSVLDYASEDTRTFLNIYNEGREIKRVLEKCKEFKYDEPNEQ